MTSTEEFYVFETTLKCPLCHVKCVRYWCSWEEMDCDDRKWPWWKCPKCKWGIGQEFFEKE